ncbi:MAG: glutamine amidotransferase [Janthinobacterium lividum]
MKNVLAVRHVQFEDLGILESLFADAGYRVDYVDAPVDALREADWRQADIVVVLGGPIGAYEEQKYPFLQQELVLIEQRLASGQALLGICLGAQLIARAAGALVYGGPVKEIGWAPLTLTDAGKSSPLALLEDGSTVLHWHGDTFDLPPRATLLASTAAYVNQAFSIGPQVLALQFHIEMTTSRLESWLVGHAAELSYAQIDLPTLRRDALQHRSHAASVLASWLEQIETAPHQQRATA